MADNADNPFETEQNDQPVSGPAETTDAGTEGLETTSVASGDTDNATPDVPPVVEPTASAEAGESVKDESEVPASEGDTKKDGETDTLPMSGEGTGLDRLLDITIGAVVVAAEATKQAARQVRENGPEVAQNLAEKGRPVREKLAAQIKERGFGPSALPLVDADGTEPADPANAVVATPDASTDPALTPGETAEAASDTTPSTAATTTPVKPPITLPPGSSALDEISLLERRVRAMEDEVGPLDPTRLAGDPDGPEDSEVSDPGNRGSAETPAEAGTYVPNELNEADAELEAVPQFIDSPYAVSENDDEQAREADPDLANGRDFDRPSPSDPFGDEANPAGDSRT